MSQLIGECTVCQSVKSADQFHRLTKKARKGHCKQCASEKDLIFRRSKDGWAFNIYKRQRRSSRERNHPFDAYTLSELKQWVFAQEIFHTLHKEWVESNYETKKTPSLDRLDDYKPYTFGNLRIVTWKENDEKFHVDRKAGINNKTNTPVRQYSKTGEFIAEFYSCSAAGRALGIDPGGITACRKGKLKTSGGFVWKKN